MYGDSRKRTAAPRRTAVALLLVAGGWLLFLSWTSISTSTGVTVVMALAPDAAFGGDAFGGGRHQQSSHRPRHHHSLSSSSSAIYVGANDVGGGGGEGRDVPPQQQLQQQQQQQQQQPGFVAADTVSFLQPPPILETKKQEVSGAMTTTTTTTSTPKKTDSAVTSYTTLTRSNKVQWIPDGGLPMYLEDEPFKQLHKMDMPQAAAAAFAALTTTSSRPSLFESDGGMMLKQNHWIDEAAASKMVQVAMAREKPAPTSNNSKLSLFESDGGMMQQQTSIIQASKRLVQFEGSTAVETKPKSSMFTSDGGMMQVLKAEVPSAATKRLVRYRYETSANNVQPLPIESAPITIDVPSLRERKGQRLYLTSKAALEAEPNGQHFANFHQQGIMYEQNSGTTRQGYVVDSSVIDTTAVASSSSSSSSSSSTPKTAAAMMAGGADQPSMPNTNLVPMTPTATTPKPRSIFVQRDIDFVTVF